MRKILGALALVMIVAFPMVLAGGSNNIEFQIHVVQDTTISIPTLCETSNSTVNGVLEFTPGITGTDESSALSSADARPDDGCGDASTYGDYNISNDGNVYIDLNFKLNESAPTGVYIAVGNQTDYNDVAYISLSTTDQTPSWAQNLPPTGSDVLQVWQRVGADDTASGASTFYRQIVITSIMHSG